MSKTIEKKAKELSKAKDRSTIKFKTQVIGMGIVVLLVAFGIQPALQDDIGSVLSAFEDVAGEVDRQRGATDSFVNRVVDGDTIVLEDGRSVRYLYIDTPETKKPNEPVYCYGPEASAYNKKLVENKEVILVPDKEKTDRYGRTLALIYLPGEDTSDPTKSINAKLVQNGFARSVSYSPNTTFKKDFETLEQKAQQRKKGLWGACDKPFEE